MCLSQMVHILQELNNNGQKQNGLNYNEQKLVKANGCENDEYISILFYAHINIK